MSGLTPQQLEEAKELCEKAPGEEWFASEVKASGDYTVRTITGNRPVARIRVADLMGWTQTDEGGTHANVTYTAAFIAASRSLLPALVEEVEAKDTAIREALRYIPRNYFHARGILSKALNAGSEKEDT